MTSSGPDLTGQVQMVDYVAKAGYRMYTPVAHGGMSDIFLGGWIDASKSHEKLALKFLRFMHDDDKRGKSITRLARETKAWAKLSHPNIHPYLGTALNLDIYPESPAIVSPWMVNGDMSNYIQKTRYANKDILLLQIIQGLVYLHSQGVVHGDLKGNNILIDNNGVAMITDFGRCKIMDDFDYSASVMTHAAYVAPEIFRDEHINSVTFRSDVWSLGMTALELFSGTKPLWRGERPIRIFHLVINREQPQPVDYPDFPGRYWEAFQNCWEFSPTDRPNADTILQRLQAQQQFHTSEM
ncbi:kinase-like protein [Rickenella mellea]|uniref:Kinase-like protein n=1 Tax=Rickenella mellea TaxID=50990 RepID=A0A4Y7PWL4_9AGAM|nr:kinase-like protein [Rickenella mellea]